MSIKPLDRVTEAYKGELGEAFAYKTRERINWIVNQVQGEKVLDIGCSQGIIPIILGREGKRVKAIDIMEESIEYAKEELKSEHMSVQENVDFINTSFMTEEYIYSDYDTILLTEVLEHISDTTKFLNKIYNSLSENGLLVVTVPFGINDYFDHKRTYYVSELYEQLGAFFRIKEVKYLGKWIGCICVKETEKTEENYQIYSKSGVLKLEEAFFKVEREYQDRIYDYQKEIATKNKLIANKDEQIKNISKVNQTEKYEEEVREYKLIIGNIREELASLQKKYDEQKSMLLESIDKEEIALKQLLVERNEKEDLKCKISILQNNYNKLKNSKLGALTLKYWALRRSK